MGADQWGLVNSSTSGTIAFIIRSATLALLTPILQRRRIELILRRRAMVTRPFVFLITVAALAAALLLFWAGPVAADGAGDFRKGAIAYSEGDSEQAIVHFTQAIQFGDLASNNLAITYNNRGNAYLNIGNFDGAIADYGEALRLDPGYAAAYNNRGSAYNSFGKFDRAIADYDTALRIDMGYALAYYNRGLAYANLCDFDRASADFAEAERLGFGVPNNPLIKKCA